jgi:perosamine synthetase
VENALRSSHLTRGPRTEEFEERAAHELGKQYAVACCNGTAALYMAYRAWFGNRKAPLSMSDITFKATANAAVLADYKVKPEPVGTDVKVDFAGMVNKTEECEVEDASHAWGSDGVGEGAGVVAMSLHAIKNLGVGEGGLVATDDLPTLGDLVDLRNHGKPGAPSFNFWPSEMTCALALSRMTRTEQEKQERRGRYHVYENNLNVLHENDIHLPHKGMEIMDDGDNPHLCVYYAETKEKAEAIGRSFRNDNIQFIKHYPPLSMLGFGDGVLSTSKDYWDRCVTLPMYLGMTNADQTRVIEAVKSA